MPHRDWKHRVQDILNAINEIQAYTAGMDFDSFCRDIKTVKAVLYCFATIGEAARHIPSDVKEKYVDIPWREMGDFRNVVIHEYFGVDLDIVWRTVRYELPSLLTLIERLSKTLR